MKTLAVMGALFLSVPTAQAEKYWCGKIDGKPALFVTNDQETASVLFVEGREPNYMPHQEQVLVAANPRDPLDLRASWTWKVEDRMFGRCRADFSKVGIKVPGVEMPVPGRK